MLLWWSGWQRRRCRKFFLPPHPQNILQCHCLLCCHLKDLFICSLSSDRRTHTEAWLKIITCLNLRKLKIFFCAYLSEYVKLFSFSNENNFLQQVLSILQLISSVSWTKETEPKLSREDTRWKWRWKLRPCAIRFVWRSGLTGRLARRAVEEESNDGRGNTSSPVDASQLHNGLLFRK